MKIKEKIVLIVILLFAILFQFVNADIISLNSGGSDEIIVNPSKYIEDFFSGEAGVQVLSVCGNGILETPYEDCDDGNTVEGDGCSSTCREEGGGGGGGGGQIVTPSGIFLRIDPREIRRNMLINTNIEETIGITNLNSTRINFSVNSSGFNPDLIVSFWDTRNRVWVNSFTLFMNGNEIYELRVRFSAPSEMGLYNGSIYIDKARVPVRLNVQEKLLLFDSNIIVLNKDYLVPQGEKLRTSVTLIPIGDKERLDVTLNYVIKDYDNKVYLTRSETVLVEEQVNFKRSFDTGVLPLGPYIVGLELIYPNGVAPSSAHFEVIEGRQSTLFGRLVFFLINLILIILIIIILLIIWRTIKQLIIKRKEEEKYFSLVITAAEYGKDSKSDLLNNFTLSCRGKDSSELLDVAKVEIMSGNKLDEIDLDKLNELLKPLIISEKGREVRVKPSVILEVTSKEIQNSDTNSSGWMLKSPLAIRIKSSKNLSEITKLNHIEKVFNVEKEQPKEEENDNISFER